MQKADQNYVPHKSAVVNEGYSIGEGTKILHFPHILPDCTVGKNCNIGQNVVVSPEVVLGNNVKVQNNISIYSGAIYEDDVVLGPSMVFTNVANSKSSVNRRGQYAKTEVKNGATVVCGHNISKYAFIGAGAVVTKDVSAYALVVGNPVRQICWMSEFGHRLEFNGEGLSICQESGEKYLLNEGLVKKI